MSLALSDFDPLGNGSYTADVHDIVTDIPGGGFVLDLLDGAGSSPAASTPTPTATPASSTASKLLASPLVLLGGLVLLVVLVGSLFTGRK